MSDKPTSINLGTSRSLLQESGSSFSVFKMVNKSIDRASSQSHTDLHQNDGTTNHDGNDETTTESKSLTTSDTNTSWLSNKSKNISNSSTSNMSERGDACSDNMSMNSVLSSINTNDSLLRILSAKRAEVESEVIQLVEKGDVQHFMALYSEHQYKIDLLHMKGMQGFSPLHYACQRGHFTMVSLLLRICPDLLYLSNMNGETALHLGVYSGKLLLIEQLIDKAKKDGTHPGTAMGHNDNTSAVGARNGGGNGYDGHDGNGGNGGNGGNTSDGGSGDSNGLINAQTRDGETALMLAASRNQPAIVRMLLSHNAATDLRDKYDDSVWDYGENHSTVLAALEMGQKESNDKDTTTTTAASEGSKSSGGTSGATSGASLGVEEVEYVFLYLNAAEICRCAMVSTKWHRVSESDLIWTRLGTRRWELALQASLGLPGSDFAGSATSMFIRPSTSNKGKKEKKSNSRPPSK